MIDNPYYHFPKLRVLLTALSWRLPKLSTLQLTGTFELSPDDRHPYYHLPKLRVLLRSAAVLTTLKPPLYKSCPQLLRQQTRTPPETTIQSAHAFPGAEGTSHVIEWPQPKTVIRSQKVFFWHFGHQSWVSGHDPKLPDHKSCRYSFDSRSDHTHTRAHTHNLKKLSLHKVCRSESRVILTLSNNPSASVTAVTPVTTTATTTTTTTIIISTQR